MEDEKFRKKRMLSNIVLLLISVIWGFSMVAQRMGMSYIQPFTFCFIRFSLGVAALIPVVLFSRKRKIKALAAAGKAPEPLLNKQAWTGGLLCGITIFFAVGLQQIALVDTAAGKTGFITALYIVLVPLAGLFVKQYPPKAVWLAVALALAGLYLLCIKEGFSIAPMDFVILISTVFYAAQIWIISFYSKRVDPLCFTVVELGCVAILSFVAMLLFEEPVWDHIRDCGPILAYVGFISVGLAYSVQVAAQKHADTTVAALILSMEAAFSALGGYLLLGEVLSPRESAGCFLMLAAIIIAQLPERKQQDRKRDEIHGSAENGGISPAQEAISALEGRKGL